MIRKKKIQLSMSRIKSFIYRKKAGQSYPTHHSFQSTTNIKRADPEIAPPRGSLGCTYLMQASDLRGGFSVF